jgi:type VI secretion system protein ImpK
MSDDPFAEPGDAERTVIRPRPGGRSNVMPPRSEPVRVPPPPTAPPPVVARAAPRTDTASTADTPAPNVPFGTPSGSPLAAAAIPLLLLLARLRNAAHRPDPDNLYDRTTLALRTFERRARDAGVPNEQLRSAHYALCISIDDVVLNTPWGAASNWAKRPLALAFHQDTSEGGRFFELLARLRQTPAKFMPVIEIMYLCLSLGVMGRYRSAPQGSRELDRLRAETCALIVGQPSIGRELSPHWKGVAAPYMPSRGGVPVWVAYAAALALCGALFLSVSTALNAASDGQYARMLAAAPAHMPHILRAVAVQPPPQPPAPPEPTILDRLQASLRPDIDSGVVSIVGTSATPVIRVSNRNGFASGSAVPQPNLVAVLQRVGTALKNEPGQVQVIGYTDDRPIRTVQFPSNFQLSSARAQAASAAIARTLGNASRISSEGRADADPIASNATAEGREQNRRIEIVLHRPD